MAGALPRVEIAAVRYFRDDQLREFRRCDNPHERIPLLMRRHDDADAFRGRDVRRCSLRACDVEE
jgi:hypothetical protein